MHDFARQYTQDTIHHTGTDWYQPRSARTTDLSGIFLRWVFPRPLLLRCMYLYLFMFLCICALLLFFRGAESQGGVSSCCISCKTITWNFDPLHRGSIHLIQNSSSFISSCQTKLTLCYTHHGKQSHSQRTPWCQWNFFCKVPWVLVQVSSLLSKPGEYTGQWTAIICSYFVPGN